ncbi:MAG: hypothetical protein WA705_07810 [Candidatus Ozemobacteraceae bacterium]
MTRILRVHLPAFLSLIFLTGVLLFLPGCGKNAPEPAGKNGPTSGKSSFTSVTTSLNPLDKPDSRMNRFASPASSLAALEQAAARDTRISAQLRDASLMMKSANLDGALRLVQRVQQENPNDPYTGMQANYLKAMIFHRMKDAPRRKEAMNSMLRSLETVQKDPKYKEAVDDGHDAGEVIKMSLERGGKTYAHP